MSDGMRLVEWVEDLEEDLDAGDACAAPRLYVSAAFSLSMLYRGDQADPEYQRTPYPVDGDAEAVGVLAEARLDGAEVVSVIGHEDTARVLSGVLGVDLPVSRVAIRLEPLDRLLVGQIVHKDGSPVRLPVGADTLPPGVRLEWWEV